MPDKQFHSFSGTVFSIIGDNDSFGKTVYFKFIHTNLTFTVAGCAFIIGGLLVAFSQEVIEDEFIANLRLQSFQWAFLINYVVLFLLFVFVYGTPFLWAIIYQMFLILILFIARFHYLLLKNKN